jgi:hypothetical protein
MGGPHTMTHRYKDMERTSVGRNRLSPNPGCGEARGQNRGITRVDGEGQKTLASSKSEARAGAAPHTANIVTRQVSAGMTGQVMAHRMCVTL